MRGTRLTCKQHARARRVERPRDHRAAHPYAGTGFFDAAMAVSPFAISRAMRSRLDDFYAGYDEAGRLARNRLELLRTQELLRARLPPAPARILDVGGGTGAHAEWLQRDGYAVTLIELVPAHVEAARARGLTARHGDARALAELDASAEATLLLGPLYHLPDAADRARALTEAVRVTRPGGLVFAAAIARTAWPLYAMRDDAPLEALDATLATGVGDPVGTLPDAYSHHPHELAAELRKPPPCAERRTSAGSKARRGRSATSPRPARSRSRASPTPTPSSPG